MIDENKLAEWILDELSSTGYLTTDCIAKVWMIDVGEALMRETLERLEKEGKIKSLNDGTRWKLQPRSRKYPVPEEVMSDGS